MTRLDGRFIKPGSIPADRLDPAIPIGGGGLLPDGAVTPAKLAEALLRKFVAVTWGEALDTVPNVKLAPLQLKDYLDQPIPAAHVLRITCDDRARLNVGEHGQALSGVDSADLIAQALRLPQGLRQELTVSPDAADSVHHEGFNLRCRKRLGHAAHLRSALSSPDQWEN